jgi:hypothetical protein
VLPKKKKGESMNGREISAVILASALLIAVSGCLDFRGCINGSGNLKDEKRDLARFDGIELSGSAILHLTQGSPQSVRLEAEDNILDAISTEVSNGVLHIGTKRCIRNTRPIKVYATAEKIESIAVSGSGSIIGTNTITSDDLRLEISGSGASDLDLRCRTLQMDISGSGRARLSGRVVEQSAQISGSGSILGYNLSTDRSDLTLSGSGTAQVNVSKELSVDISGSGMVYYIGSPGTIKESITGSGKLERAR